MNNIIVYLIIFLTRLISIIPRNFFINNFFIKKIFEIGLKKRRKIISANINHCFSDKDSKWRDKLVKDTCDESIGAIFDNNLAWNATSKKIKSLDNKIRGIELLDEAKKNNSPLPITKIVDEYYAEVQKMGGQRWDTSSLIKRFRK